MEYSWSRADANGGIDAWPANASEGFSDLRLLLRARSTALRRGSERGTSREHGATCKRCLRRRDTRVVTTAAVSALTLRNGVTIDDPLATALEFVVQDSSYLKYELAPVAHDDVLTLADVQIANWMIARMSPAVVEGIYARADAINAALALIPPSATLAGRVADVPWDGLAALMRAIYGAREVGLARATKVLHKKRPALVPILDSVLEKYLRTVDSVHRSGDFALDAVALIHSYKRELDASLPTLRVLQAELRTRTIELTEVRLLDLFLWGYSGTYTPLYLRDGVAATSPPSVRRPPRAATSASDHAVEVFRDDDTGYLAWLADHPRGFVLNANRSPRPDYLIVHRATCRTISGKPTRGGPWTGPYIKVCADDLLEVAAWAGASVGAPPRRCRVCSP